MIWKNSEKQFGRAKKNRQQGRRKQNFEKR